MKKFDVFLSGCAEYLGIEADTKEEAIEQAFEWWVNRIPYVHVKESKEEDE